MGAIKLQHFLGLSSYKFANCLVTCLLHPLLIIITSMLFKQTKMQLIWGSCEIHIAPNIHVKKAHYTLCVCKLYIHKNEEITPLHLIMITAYQVGYLAS